LDDTPSPRRDRAKRVHRARDASAYSLLQLRDLRPRLPLCQRSCPVC
jgi:hypothetical protein